MAPVAAELSAERGVLEPWQTAMTVGGQVEELNGLLRAEAELPVALAGFSWGAWLSLLLAARHPDTVRKLILISSGPFEQSYASQILATRLSRLGDAERGEAEAGLRELGDPGKAGRALQRLGQLFQKTDAHDPLPEEPNEIPPSPEIFHAVWEEAAELRRSGKLLDAARQVRCPVVAIHGDYDPHPAEGVRGPLSAAITNFRFHLLPNCGHRPWLERKARDRFYAILRAEI